MAKQRFFTNAERTRRGIRQSSECPQCDHANKDTMHVFHDCAKAKEVWKLIVPIEKQARNGSRHLKIHHHCFEDWVFLSTDGAVTRSSRNASAGGEVRDRDRHWILGFTYFLGRCSPFEVELWGILDGILILLTKGYKRVRIQTDNIEVVRALSMEETVDSGITLLRRVKRILRSEGQWEIMYVPREYNLVADKLANIGLSWQTSLQIFELPPDVVTMSIQQAQDFSLY
ncbi:hypothetical protein PVK06_048294 [Gossypium arboreum]|uniref:RNase H type-1 domain-containing protein n=1 Tax=Gossypium arboreum TaxID=29729 RepID=A0ABR0MFN4_GOSAR|nr:hypothetical protein PVK06_048294 [Gossypium arboreum]